jgi:hypothetical protein
MPLSKPQQTIVEAQQRFKVVIAGRRFWQDSPQHKILM